MCLDVQDRMMILGGFVVYGKVLFHGVLLCARKPCWALTPMAPVWQHPEHAWEPPIPQGFSLYPQSKHSKHMLAKYPGERELALTRAREELCSPTSVTWIRIPVFVLLGAIIS